MCALKGTISYVALTHEAFIEFVEGDCVCVRHGPVLNVAPIGGCTCCMNELVSGARSQQSLDAK